MNVNTFAVDIQHLHHLTVHGSDFVSMAPLSLLLLPAAHSPLLPAAPCAASCSGVLSVAVYPSDYGLAQMAKEQAAGPQVRGGGGGGGGLVLLLMFFTVLSKVPCFSLGGGWRCGEWGVW